MFPLRAWAGNAVRSRTAGSSICSRGIHCQNPISACPRAAPQYTLAKAGQRVTCYFYQWDANSGPAFIKGCAYLPYAAQI